MNVELAGLKCVAKNDFRSSLVAPLTDSSFPVSGWPKGVPGPNITPRVALAEMVAGLSETRRRSVRIFALTRSRSLSGKLAFRATSPRMASESRQVVFSPSEVSRMCSLLASARRWLPRNSISSEIWAELRVRVPSGSIVVVR